MLSTNSSTSRPLPTRPSRRGSTRPWSGRSARRAGGCPAARSSGRTPSPPWILDRHVDESVPASRGRSRCPRGYARPRRRTPTGPRARLAMLLISSIMLTVLPTPAPPNRPTLPPLANGHIRSMTLMPVSSSSLADGLVFVARRRAVDFPMRRRRSTGPASSIGRPSTSMMRPSVPMPTGTEIARAGVVGDQVALQAVGRTERDRAHDAVAELLLHFQRDRRCSAPSARRTPSARSRAGIRRRRPRR